MPPYLTSYVEGAKEFPKPILDSIKKENGIPIIEECWKNLFGLYYLSDVVGKAWQQLYTPNSKINIELHKYWEILANALKDMPEVIAYELMNEPYVGDIYSNPKTLWFGYSEKNLLTPLYDSLTQTIRKIDSRHVIMFGHMP